MLVIAASFSETPLHPKIIIAQGTILANGLILRDRRIHTDYFRVIQWKNPIRMVSERNRICYDR